MTQDSCQDAEDNGQTIAGKTVKQHLDDCYLLWSEWLGVAIPRRINLSNSYPALHFFGPPPGTPQQWAKLLSGQKAHCPAVETTESDAKPIERTDYDYVHLTYTTTEGTTDEMIVQRDQEHWGDPPRRKLHQLDPNRRLTRLEAFRLAMDCLDGKVKM